MIRGGDFIRKGKCKNIHCSVMSKFAWFDLKKNKFLRLHDYCPDPKCKCQKRNTFTLKQFHLKGAVFKKNNEQNIQRKSKSLELIS